MGAGGFRDWQSLPGLDWLEVSALCRYAREPQHDVLCPYIHFAASPSSPAYEQCTRTAPTAKADGAAAPDAQDLQPLQLTISTHTGSVQTEAGSGTYVGPWASVTAPQ